MLSAFIVYCSPAGTTRHVGQFIQRQLAEFGEEARVLDLGSEKDWMPAIRQINDAPGTVNLFIGSPVYGGLPIPPVMDFIEALDTTPGARYAVPYVTWGLVSSGLALWLMGRALVNKGFMLAGGVSVPALHSLQWESPSPVGEGRPSPGDEAQLCRMVDDLYPRLATQTVSPLPLNVFDYQLAEESARLKASTFDQLRARLPRKQLEEALCTQCDVCEQGCPAGAITCEPYPQIDEARCIVCYNCVRLCPEHAIQADLTDIFDGLPQWAQESKEPHVTAVYAL